MSNFKIYDKLPLAVSFKPKTGTPLAIKSINRHLGITLYPRLAAIYQNILQAIAYSNNSYIKKNSVPELFEEFTKRRDYHKKLGLKMKINEPTKKLLPLKNYIMPERTYRNDNFYISLVAKVYWGGQLSQPASYHFPSSCRLLKIGLNRVIVWNSELSGWQNMLSWYNNQIYEFRVRYQSNLYIKCIDSNNSSEAYPRAGSNGSDLGQDTVSSEFVLRSGNDRFDWVLVDINRIVQDSKQTP